MYRQPVVGGVGGQQHAVFAWCDLQAGARCPAEGSGDAVVRAISTALGLVSGS
jgi:hypothetical protein